MAVSISLTQVTLTVLFVWVMLARRVGVLGPLRWPLLLPMVAFAGWSAVAALVSDRPAESVLVLKSLLTLGTIFLVVNALPDATATRHFVTWLGLALVGAAVAGIVQVASCPGPIVDPATTV